MQISYCTPEFKILLKDIRAATANIELFVVAMRLVINRMCHFDLRKFIKQTVGLLNNVLREDMISRAQQIYEHRANLDEFRNTN